MLTATLALAQQPSAERLFQSAAEAQQRGDLPVAIRDYQKLLQLEPKLTEVRVNLGAALAGSGRLDEAIAQYQLALKALPENGDVRRNLGLAYYKKGDLAAAAREFQSLHAAQPNDAQLAILLGDSEVRSGKGPEALAALEPLEAANADNPDFEYVMGTALLASGKRREAVARLQKVADTTQGVDAYFLAGSTLLDLHEAEQARKDLDVALRLNPALPRIYTLAGMARDQAGDQNAAAEVFRVAVKQNPSDFDANLYLGAILSKQRDLAGAKPYLDQAVALQPDSNLARYELAKWKSNSGQYASAATDFEAVVQKDPDWLEPHVELATVYYRLHRPEDGAKQRAIVTRLTEQQQTRGPGK